jgi:two-component system phosphate regulon sensor histidine kinase PhoR
LKFARQAYAIVTTVVVCSLLAVTLAGWKDSPVTAAASKWYDVPLLIAYCIAAMGVIWLGWRCVRLAGAVTSIAKWLKQDQPVNNRPKLSAITEELTRAIDDRVKEYSGTIDQLQNEVKDLQLQIQLSHRQKRNTEAIIYSLRDAVIVIDELDRLLMANEAAGRLFDFDYKNAQHKPIGELVDKSKGVFIDFLRQSRRSKIEATRREIQLAQDARARTFDCIVSCVYDQCQEVCGVVAVLHDITREKEISQMKNDFVSHVSHELKTPLASITAYSEMLADGEADDEKTRKQFYSIIQNQAKRLNRLIEDILNISRIESGLIKVEKKPVSLTILIEEQLQMIKGYAEEKNINVITQKPIVYDQVYADRDMISQVIVNLLSNAIKYTPSGGSVSVDTAVDETAGIARVTVTDTGVGIPPDEIGHIFDKFYRVDANKKQAKGTGLGLNLVKQIVEKVHDGRVFVSSQPGVGSTFGFELPLAAAQMRELQSTQSSQR